MAIDRSAAAQPARARPPASPGQQQGPERHAAPSQLHLDHALDEVGTAHRAGAGGGQRHAAGFGAHMEHAQLDGVPVSGSMTAGPSTLVQLTVTTKPASTLVAGRAKLLLPLQPPLCLCWYRPHSMPAARGLEARTPCSSSSDALAAGGRQGDQGDAEAGQHHQQENRGDDADARHCGGARRQGGKVWLMACCRRGPGAPGGCGPPRRRRSAARMQGQASGCTSALRRSSTARAAS